MKADDLLKMIGESREEYILAAQESREGNAQNHKRLARGHLLFIAAIVALMLFLMGSAVVAMRLQHLTIRFDPGDRGGIKPAVTDTVNGKGDETNIIGSNPLVAESTVPDETDMNGEEINLISIQGYMGSDSYAAFKEWQDFLETYDSDNSILYANNHKFQCPEAYASYHCYSQEMVDKIDEICEKYNLRPLGNYWYFTRGKDVFDAVGIESVFSGSEETGYLDYSGYCFSDGTFSVEGQLELAGEWSSMVSFNYRSVLKTSFDGVARNIGDISKYNQWNYTMMDGTNVLLALREEGALIIVDKEDSFVTIGAVGTLVHGNNIKFPMERDFLETLCEAFDFTYETNQVDAAKADELYQAQLEREARGENDRIKYTVNHNYPDTYKGIIDYLVNEIKYTGLHYVLIDVDGDSVEELLLQCVNLLSYDGNKNSFFSIYTMRDGEACEVFSVKGSNLYLCQGGVFDQSYSNGHYYFRFLPGFESLDYVGYNTQDGQWYTDSDGHHSNASRVVITEEEAKVIIAQYPRIDIEFRPVSEFSGQ